MYQFFLAFSLLVSAVTCSGAHDMKKKVKIAFVINELSFRGIEVSTFDYADCNETILNNESIIINFDTQTDNAVRQKFFNRFGKKFFDCASLDELDFILAQEAVDILYYQKPGHNDGVLSKVCKNAVHAVFPQKIEPHGDVYAYISEWFTQLFPELNLPFVPYMVRVHPTQQNLREELKIPREALVFGRHGGATTFNVPSAQEAVIEVAKKRSDIFFLFLNTDEFCSLPNVIFLPKTTDFEYKAKFINSCDAMLHARWRGETFGLACAEFSVKNKPIITWREPRERAHIEILGEHAYYFSTKQELVDILLNFKKEPHKEWDVYSKPYNPQAVMQQFDTIFIQPLLRTSVPCQSKKKLWYKPARLNNETINPEFIKQLKTTFADSILIKDQEDALLDSLAVQADKRFILFFDLYWQKNINFYVPSLQEQLTYALSRRTDSIFVIDGIHLIDQQSLESVYFLLTNHGYQFLINFTTVIACKDDLCIDPLISAMTSSFLGSIGLIKVTNTTQLITTEHTVARIVSNYGYDLNLIASSATHTYCYQVWRALLHLHKKEYSMAAKIMSELIAQKTVDWRYHWYLGQALYKMGSITAEESMLKVINTVPTFPGILEFKKNINT